MTQTVWFTVLFAALLVWLALGTSLLRLLRNDHREIYESLGSPSLLSNNTIRNNWLSLKFLLTGAYRDLDDERVTRLCRVLRGFLVLLALWFAGAATGELLGP